MDRYWYEKGEKLCLTVLFTLRKAKEELNLNFVEGVKFIPNLDVITPSANLTEFLHESIPLAIAMGSEKARSELIISPILFEVRKQLNRQISFFSGEEFNVDESIGLNGVCDFLISRSTEQLFCRVTCGCDRVSQKR